MPGRTVTVERTGGQAQSVSRPYPPSWLDALVRWIERDAGPPRGREAAVGGGHERLEAALTTLHGVVDEEAVPMREEGAARLAQTRIDALNKAISSLLQEREFIGRQSTLPWDTGTFRAVASAVMLPIALFLLTRALERFGL